MAALGAYTAITGATKRELIPSPERKMIEIEIPESAGADNGDTFTVDLATFGCTRPCGIIGFDHTTDGSVVVTAAPTTSVASSVLTITIGGSTANITRVFWISMR